MNGAFYIGATGLHAQQRALDVIADNIANMNTPAFKRSAVRFAEMVSPMRSDFVSAAADRAEPNRIDPSGVSVASLSTVFVQGDLRSTGDPMDLAISGDGFVEVLGPGGRSLLWRGGGLKVGEDGFLTTMSGMPLKAMMSMPTGATDIAIGRDGVVLARADGDAEIREIGRLELVVVRDEAGLRSIGEGLYEPSEGAVLASIEPDVDGAGAFVQGALEASNVALTDEMVTLLLMQRAYAANAQVVQAGDQLMSIANGLRR